jgi:hypothetical protein
MDEILNLIITTGIPSVLAFFAGTWKRNRANESAYINNLNKSLESYSLVISEMEKRYEAELRKLEKRVCDYERRIDEYEEEISVLRMRIKELENELNYKAV